MSAKRKAPKPMGKPMRFLTAAVAVAFVASLGFVITKHPGNDEPAETGDATGVTIDTDTGQEGNGDGDDWKGLRAAGIPTPAEWSRQKMVKVAGDDGSGEADYTPVPIDGEFGAIDTALSTIDRILDPTTGDDEWNAMYASLLDTEAPGGPRPMSNAPRYWWSKRRFASDSACSKQSDETFGLPYDQGMCSAEGEWTRSGDESIQGIQYYKETSFPIPDGLDISGRTDPQSVVSKAWDTIQIPMDDGIWHITVYCPATLDQPFVDKDGNEVEKDSETDKYTGRYSSTGIGTRQRPCQTVEVAVGGQKPFWAAGSASGNTQ